MSKINVLVFPSDRTGVSKFRSVEPHMKLQELYNDDFHIEIVTAGTDGFNWDDESYLKKFQIVQKYYFSVISASRAKRVVNETGFRYHAHSIDHIAISDKGIRLHLFTGQRTGSVFAQSCSYSWVSSTPRMRTIRTSPQSSPPSALTGRGLSAGSKMSRLGPSRFRESCRPRILRSSWQRPGRTRMTLRFSAALRSSSRRRIRLDLSGGHCFTNCLWWVQNFSKRRFLNRISTAALRSGEEQNPVGTRWCGLR